MGFNSMFRCRLLGNSTLPLPDAAQGISYAELDSSEFMSLCDLDEASDALPDQVEFAKGFAQRMRQEGGFQRWGFARKGTLCWLGSIGHQQCGGRDADTLSNVIVPTLQTPQVVPKHCRADIELTCCAGCTVCT
jgi:hypothetical protein